ncbi:unnamed protein product [Lactuca saligna]|uniref:Uncharacterized protein n=1 Tax=Lactuca saligna TaxID=75948 RepID=A0AA35YXZ2_LACSI|nr:unnamed protein product [Lactuca saligna]
MESWAVEVKSGESFKVNIKGKFYCRISQASIGEIEKEKNKSHTTGNMEVSTSMDPEPIYLSDDDTSSDDDEDNKDSSHDDEEEATIKKQYAKDRLDVSASKVTRYGSVFTRLGLRWQPPPRVNTAPKSGRLRVA